MVKKKVEKKERITLSGKNVLLIIIATTIVVLITLFATGVLKLNSFNSNQDNEKNLSMNDFYSEDICRCLEKFRAACSLDGFEYNATRKLCVNYAEKRVTYNTWGCSLYECAGIKYSFNNNTSGWEAE